MRLTKADLKKELQSLGIKVEGNYVRKKDIEKIITSGKTYIDDYNGLWDRFQKAFPKIAKKLQNDNSFWSGINSVSKMSVNGKEFLFIETPGHGWIVDMSGKIVGEEDGGFDDPTLNTNLKDAFKGMQKILG